MILSSRDDFLSVHALLKVATAWFVFGMEWNEFLRFHLYVLVLSSSGELIFHSNVLNASINRLLIP